MIHETLHRQILLTLDIFTEGCYYSLILTGGN